MTLITEDIYVEFNFNSFSKESKELLLSISDLIIKSGIKSNKNKLLNALCSLNVALMKAAIKGPGISAYRSMGAKALTGEIVGFRPFSNAVNGMEALGLIERKGGHYPVPGFETEPAKASRFKTTEKLRSLWESHGIKPIEWDQHFEGRPRPGAIANPIVLKSEKKKGKHRRTGKPIAIPSEKMPFDPTNPLALKAGNQVNEINAFLAGQDIQPSYAFYAFQRIFSLGDNPSFSWDKGGRLYAIGGGYQQWPAAPKPGEKNYRGEITINGEPTVEIDIRASHLTILHALKHVPMPPDDPYSGTEFPRFVVKSWVAMTLGSDKRPGNQWSKTAKDAYVSKQCGIRKSGRAVKQLCQSTCKATCLQKLFPMRKVGPKIASHFPILDDWETSPWRWADLQYIESKAIIDAVHELATVHGIPALPVHDSIIAPASKREIAAKVLADMFEKHVGIRPVLK
ncbi:hypothetical protein VH570_15770 [Sphingobium sp. HT1-2]|uniref:hypothetical protein n=1 Tax=Sphingobium sp. HT1-2 TaxID=3111640 RepID=UPI003C04EC4C